MRLQVMKDFIPMIVLLRGGVRMSMYGQLVVLLLSTLSPSAREDAAGMMLFGIKAVLLCCPIIFQQCTLNTVFFGDCWISYFGVKKSASLRCMRGSASNTRNVNSSFSMIYLTTPHALLPFAEYDDALNTVNSDLNCCFTPAGVY